MTPGATSALTVTEAIREMVELHREEARTVRAYNPDTARVILRVVDRFEAVVDRQGPEWVPLSDLERLRGWSRRWLRDRAAELAASGKARKAPHWEIRADAAAEIPPKRGHERPEITLDDIEAAAERLAGPV